MIDTDHSPGRFKSTDNAQTTRGVGLGAIHGSVALPKARPAYVLGTDKSDCWKNRCAIAAMLFVLGWIAGCGNTGDQALPMVERDRPSSEIAITTFCGNCHVYPPPSSFPKHMWREEVEQGFRIYGDSGRSDLVRPDIEATIEWFESRAPDSYVFEQHDRDASESADKTFELFEIHPSTENVFPKVSNISGIGSGEFLGCELYTGLVGRFSLLENRLKKQKIARVSDPVRAHPADLDQDGTGDYVIADIGRMNPSDQRYGTLWWVHQKKATTETVGSPAAEAHSNKWDQVALQTGFSRICDARPIDYDGDGDQDLIVAEFGFIFDGSVQLLTNTGVENGIPRFESKIVDERNGAIHVPVLDLNGDGRLDFLALISQEHETIDANINLGDGRFERRTIYSAPDPAYASSGIEVVDLDQDGDEDILYTNGDTFDDHTAKPFHSVQWLENKGSFPFEHHHVTFMPGVYSAVAGDIDLDGDIDIAAVALVSRSESGGDQVSSAARPNPPSDSQFDGVIWLEQTENRNFVRHRIVRGDCLWSSCDLVDIDEDGDLDLVLGRFLENAKSNEAVRIYRNRAKNRNREISE